MYEQGRRRTMALVRLQMHTAPLITLDALIGAGPVIILAPHPDDETLGCGGLIARAAQAGIDIHVVLVTDGSASHKSRTWPPERLAALRREELRTALASLGLDHPSLVELNFKDGATPHFGAAFEKSIDDVAKLARTTHATALFTSWEGDPHPDHMATARIAAGVVRRVPQLVHYSYPIWGLFRGLRERVPASFKSAVRLDVSSMLDRKWNAIHAHKSQTTGLITDDPLGFTLTPQQLSRFTGPTEIFFRHAPIQRGSGIGRSDSVRI